MHTFFKNNNCICTISLVTACWTACLFLHLLITLKASLFSEQQNFTIDKTVLPPLQVCTFWFCLLVFGSCMMRFQEFHMEGCASGVASCSEFCREGNHFTSVVHQERPLWLCTVSRFGCGFHVVKCHVFMVFMGSVCALFSGCGECEVFSDAKL